MDWQEIVGIGAGVLQIGAIVPYIRDMLKGAARPNLASWSIWTFEVLVALFAQLSAGASWSVILLISATVINLTVACLCLFGYGYRKFGAVEVICFLLSVLALILWQVTAIPLLAILFAIAADAIAYVPTVTKTLRDPHSETPLLWFLLGLVGVMSAFSSGITNATNLSFPIYYALINFALWALVFFGQKVKNRKA